ncbi:MAG: hypothetical protein KKE77_02670 [Alphaproteobacteria bacterium]|mgnify:CR=1 FL=1|jgi:DNA uptake protein ComE-like DNA-binding protein|nr:hypothetical protein [Alphaproteobacteria bacterium]MBU2340131.1 hypothetical protein [Alphaproteobacteria bacterium]|tara:strand:+ start:7500 stop:8030 length:531 start_codon:yes stop_codon:yes gene_type:complete
MRRIIFAAAVAGTALTLTACSKGAEETSETTSQDTLADAGLVSDESAGAVATDAGAVLDANAATAEQLAVLDGVSPGLAQAIITGQPYRSVADLNRTLLATLDAEGAAMVRTRVFVPVNLNTATREEIELIPGMTDRMVGEFLEYRPYEDMAEFDREISKYVDEEEVARFRTYVTL